MRRYDLLQSDADRLHDDDERSRERSIAGAGDTCMNTKFREAA